MCRCLADTASHGHRRHLPREQHAPRNVLLAWKKRLETCFPGEQTSATSPPARRCYHKEPRMVDAMRWMPFHSMLLPWVGSVPDEQWQSSGLNYFSRSYKEFNRSGGLVIWSRSTIFLNCISRGRQTSCRSAAHSQATGHIKYVRPASWFLAFYNMRCLREILSYPLWCCCQRAMEVFKGQPKEMSYNRRLLYLYLNLRQVFFCLK
jgi:hypothetical protein